MRCRVENLSKHCPFFELKICPKIPFFNSLCFFFKNLLLSAGRMR